MIEAFLTQPLVAVFLLAPLGTVVAFVTNIWIEQARKARAYNRLKNDPFVYIHRSPYA